MKNILIYGGGGFGKEVFCLMREVNENNNQWNFLGFLDDNLASDTDLKFGKVQGGLKYLQNYPEPISVILAIGSPTTREVIFNSIKNPNVDFPNLIAPDFRALDTETLNWGQGNIVFSKCSTSVDVTIGDFNIFNSQIAMGHDAQIGDYNTFMPGTKISGSVKIGKGNNFGMNCAVLQNIRIGDRNKLGPLSVLTKSINNDGTYIGSIAKKFAF
jgi:sugar O-acyltransferase (sialic acid O-acetyltransferase NeuD family)